MQLKITLLISRTCISRYSFSDIDAKIYPCECYWLIMMLQRQAKGIEENTNSYSLQEDAVKNHSSHIFSNSCKSPLSFFSSIKYKPIVFTMLIIGGCKMFYFSIGLFGVGDIIFILSKSFLCFGN